MELMKKIADLLNCGEDILLGKEKELKLGISAIFSSGHLLIEDIPGVGKTTMVHILSSLVGLKLSRIQFTNDLLPSDIIGTTIFNQNEHEFEFKRGPLFGELVLADELNRATPKTQSALLQAMEERIVHVDGEEYQLGERFLIIATQNPHQQIGTFPLPESQLDRFFMSLNLGFPNREYEKIIIFENNIKNKIKKIISFFTEETLSEIRSYIEEKIYLSEEVKDYTLNLLTVGRNEAEAGVLLSPRSGIDLVKACKSWAFLHQRDYVLLEDVQTVVPYVWGHRLGGSLGIIHGQKIVKSLLRKVSVNK